MSSMRTSPQAVRVAREGVVHDASLAWRHEQDAWVVRIVSVVFDSIETRADDAFEALCFIRDVLEPGGWRIGVAGAQVDVWPSGMSRDQGGDLVAYRMTAEGGCGRRRRFRARRSGDRRHIERTEGQARSAGPRGLAVRRYLSGCIARRSAAASPVPRRRTARRRWPSSESPRHASGPGTRSSGGAPSRRGARQRGG